MMKPNRNSGIGTTFDVRVLQSLTSAVNHRRLDKITDAPDGRSAGGG